MRALLAHHHRLGDDTTMVICEWRSGPGTPREDWRDPYQTMEDVYDQMGQLLQGFFGELAPAAPGRGPGWPALADIEETDALRDLELFSATRRAVAVSAQDRGLSAAPHAGRVAPRRHPEGGRAEPPAGRLMWSIRPCSSASAAVRSLPRCISVAISMIERPVADARRSWRSSSMLL